MGDALRDMPEDYAAGAAFFLYIGSHISPAARRADAILPTTTFAEMDGTFVNFGGRVQRFHQAIKAPGVARPAWMVLSRLAESLGAGTGVLDIRAAVDAMAAGSDAFQSISWRKLGLKGMSLADAPAGVRLE
jgi:NADH-quinone oxidoreductase subunit G